MLWLVVDMVHLNTFSKTIVYMDVKSGDVKNDIKSIDVEVDVRSVVVEVEVREQFKSKHEFVEHEHMLQWICMEAVKLEFNVLIGRSDNDSDTRHTFVTIRCERSDKYQQPIRKLKRDDIGSRKCECPFNIFG